MGEEIGVGGMGRVYKAQHRELMKPAAVKLLTESIFSTKASLLRFASEAKICADLKHPNIVEIFDYDVTASQPYIVFEFVEGRDLSVMIDDELAVPLADLLEMVAQVADAVHYAHTQRVIHRDIKPENILVLPDNRIKVMDFGIAKRGDVNVVKTRTGVILGTPRYMSPEQAQAQKLSQGTDIYSIGVVLFELVAGVRPFEAPSDLEVLLKHLHEAPPLASDLNSDIPRALDELISDCLLKDPKERPQSAKIVAARLRDCIDQISQGRPLTVTLGCRKGTLESPFDKDLARSGKKALPKSSRSKGAGKAVPRSSQNRTREASPTQDRRKRQERRSVGKPKSVIRDIEPSLIRKYLKFAWIPFVLIAAIAFLYSSSTSKTSKVAKVAVRSVSGSGAVVTWQSDWHTENPKVSVTAGGATEIVYETLAREVKKLTSQKELPYSYSIAFSGLKSITNYAVTIPKPDGTTSFAKSFKTKINRKPEIHWYLKYTEAKKWLFILRAKVPFNVKESAALALIEPRELLSTTFRTKFVYELAEEVIKKNKRISLSIVTLDGKKENFDFKALDGLSDHCEGLFTEFRQDYKAGDFWRAFTGKNGKAVKYFYEIAGELNPKKESKPASLYASTWKTIDRRLEHLGPWYKQASALAPGVRRLNELAPLSHPLRWSCWFAVSPLMLTHGAAGMRRMTPHPHWGEAVLPSRLVDVSLGIAHIATPSFSADFLEPSLIKMEQYPFVDCTHPQAGAMTFSKEAEAVLSTRQRTLSLKGHNLSKYKEAELEVFINDGAMHRMFIVDLNKGKFKALLQTPQKDAEVWEQSLKTDSYARLGMMMFGGLGSEKMSAQETLESLNEIAHPIEETPPYRRKFYVRIPLSALNQYENTCRLTVMNSPSYYTAVSFYVGTKLRLR